MEMSKDMVLMQGNEAIAEGAIYAGARFYAGYPITPSSEIAEICSERLMEVGGVYIQMEDELASMAAIVGASLTGKKSLTATSGPGFSLMQENLGMAQMAEVPCVVVNVQRSGPSTGLATKPAQADIMQVRWGRHGDQAIIALAPASVQECFELTVKAFNLSERFRTPVVLMPDEIIGHLRESVVLPAPGDLKVIERKRHCGKPEVYLPFKPEGDDDIAPMADYGSNYIFHITSSMHGYKGYSQNDPDNAAWKIRHLTDKIYNYLDEITETKEICTEDMDLLIITSGSTVRAAHAAVKQAREEGLKVGLLQLVTVWPFADCKIAELTAGAKGVLVPEMNLGQMVHEVRRVVGSEIPVYSLTKSNGQGIEPKEIIEKIREVY
jgi:2-oxoglutarate ferredoxin oxidoreductase subunit alpha